MDDRISGQLSARSELDPFYLSIVTVCTNVPWRNHYMSAAYASHCHQLPLATVLVEGLDSRVG